jgi:hypothetical protein
MARLDLSKSNFALSMLTAAIEAAAPIAFSFLLLYLVLDLVCTLAALYLGFGLTEQLLLRLLSLAPLSLAHRWVGIYAFTQCETREYNS